MCVKVGLLSSGFWVMQILCEKMKAHEHNQPLMKSFLFVNHEETTLAAKKTNFSSLFKSFCSVFSVSFCLYFLCSSTCFSSLCSAPHPTPPYCVWEVLLLTMLHLTSPPTHTQTPPGVCDCVHVSCSSVCLIVWLGHVCVCVCAHIGRGTPPVPPPSPQPKHSGLPRLHCLGRCRPLLLLLLASPPPQVPVLLQSSMPLWPAHTTAQASLSLTLTHAHTLTLTAPFSSYHRSSSFPQEHDGQKGKGEMKWFVGSETFHHYWI